MRNALGAAGLALVMLSPGATAQAQEQPLLRLTLQEAQDRAVANSHRLAEARARESMARAGVDARAAMDRPSVSASAGYTRTNHVDEFAVPGPGGLPRVVYPDVPNNYLSRLDLQWPIYTGGRTDALERAAQAEADAASREIDIARADLRLEVARVYWAVVTARAAVAVLEQSLSRAESNLGDVRQRFDAGLVAPNETSSAEAQLARTRMLLIEARNQRAASLAELERLLGGGIGPAFEPSSSLEPAAPGVDAGPALPQAVAAEADGAADLQALRHRVDSADAVRAAAAAARRPTLAIVGGLDYGKPNPKIFPRVDRWEDAWDAGVRVTWSLWDGGRSAAEVAQATAAALAARARLADTESRRDLDVRLRQLDIDSGRAAVDAATAALRAAAEARRVVTERYRAGVLAQGDVLDAELALMQAELDRTRALAGVRLAEARLARVTQ
jgi:outer membrane protein